MSRPLPVRTGAALAVAAVVVIVAWGSRLAPDATVPGPIAVGPALSVTPPAGWTAAPVSIPAPWRAVRLSGAGADVTAADIDGVAGSPADVMEAYASTVVPGQTRDVVYGAPGIVGLASGRQAVTRSYVGVAADGTPVEGILVAILRDGGGVVFDASAPVGELAPAAGQIRETVDRAVIA
jgi:hypothetical protein